MESGHNNSNVYRTHLRQQNRKPVRPLPIIAPIWHGVHEEELVGPKERIEEPRHKLRDTELEIGEADVTKVPAKDSSSPEEQQQTLRDRLALQNWCPICVQAK